MLKTLVLFSGFIFGFFYAAVAQEINVLSYNIRFASFDNGPQNWNQRKEGVYEVLKGHDFIGLQEVLPVQMEDIRNNTGNDYSILFRTREADPSIGEGSPLLFNKNRWNVISSGFFWLSGTPEIPGSNTWGAAFNRLVTFGVFRHITSGDSLLVINTHFDHISQSAREKSVSLILEKFKSKIVEMPVVFLGDLNVTPDNPAYQKIISEASLTDSYQLIHPNDNVSGATFHGWSSDPPIERIDYIFVSRFLSVKSSEVLHDRYNGNYPSDHFPLNSILLFKR
jgi:endonuclease/exonuclease/phosphatase family metal-dependent hydrolase